MHKKSQITLFIVLGILLVVLISVGIYLFSDINSQKQETDLEQSTSQKSDVVFVKEYVESCLYDITESVGYEISLSGGLKNSGSGILDSTSKTTEINVLAEYVPGEGIVNSLPDKKDLSGFMQAQIDSRIAQCIDLESFTKKGMDVKLGQPKSNVIIVDDVIKVGLDMSISIEKGGYKSDIKEFSADVNLPLGDMYKIVADIINDEAELGYFVKEDYVLNHGTDIIIEKHKPYPDTTYTIRKQLFNGKNDLVFNFAIKGFDTAGKYILNYEKRGCCIDEGGVCHKNVDEQTCISKGGTYNDDLMCTCEDNYKEEALGCCKSDSGCFVSSSKTCLSLGGKFNEGDARCQESGCKGMDCQNTYSYHTNTFSGSAKENGESWCVYESVVGKGFDYVGTRHYVHSCINGVEYVEECRDYREELCAEENAMDDSGVYTRANCRINRWYDCYNQGESECEDNSKRDCYWIDYIHTDEKCVPYVPPGLKFWESSANDFCHIGSFNKNEYGSYLPKTWRHSTAIYCQKTGDCGPYRNYADEYTTTGYFNPDGDLEDWVYYKEGYADKGYKYEIDLDPFNTKLASSLVILEGKDSAYAVCDAWDAPAEGKCSQCNNEVHQCTEYRCKSLGRNCVYRESDNSCFVGGTGDLTPPEVSMGAFDGGYTYSISKSAYYSGMKIFEISPKIPIHQPFKMSFTTNEPTRCMLHLFPPGFNKNLIPFEISLPEIYLNDYRFKTEYNFNFTLPSSNMTTFDEYLLFLKCSDEAGNVNSNYAISVSSAEPSYDTEMPLFMDVRTEKKNITFDATNKFMLFLNEPFKDCRYSYSETLDYESMESIGCSTQEFNILYLPYYPLGSYMCSASIDITSIDDAVYFMCEDNAGNKNQLYKYSLVEE